MNNRTDNIKPGDILLFSTFRNENVRLPYFFKYYRDLGVDHFIMVDNDSTDGGRDYVASQPDVSVWTTKGSYRRSRFGVDWLNWLQRKYADGHWTLVVDPDEFFVYPFCDTRPIRALTDWLDASDVRSFGAMLLDMYPKGRIDDVPYKRGQNPIEIASWFDSGNYTISKNHLYYNLWIQGGPRARMFFKDEPWRAPALNKTPLVKWNKHYAYVSSTHMILPRGLNLVYDEWGAKRPRAFCCIPNSLIPSAPRPKRSWPVVSIMPTVRNTEPTQKASQNSRNCGANGPKNTLTGASWRFWA